MTAAAGRQPWVDSVKVCLVGAVIVAHCAMTYSSGGSWFYEEPSGEAVSLILDVPIALGSLFVMGAFFFVAGCFVPASCERKGASRFVVERSVHLGVPVVAYVVVVVPAIELTVARVTGAPASPAEVWAEQMRSLDAGPLWFAAVLLIFSLGVAALTVVGALRPRARRLRPRALVAAVAVIVVMSFVLRLQFPVDTFQVGALHVWQWGQCAGLFALGVHVGAGGLAPVSRATLTGCRWVAAGGVVALVALIAVSADDLDPLGGGPTLPAFLVAAIEGAVAVSATVVVLDVFRRRPAVGRGRWAAGAYGAYVLQAPVIVIVSLALRGVPVDPALKFLVVAPVAVFTCFTVASHRRGAHQIAGQRVPSPRLR